MLEELEIVHILCLKLLIPLSSPFLIYPGLLLGQKSNGRRGRGFNITDPGNPTCPLRRHKIQNPRAITMTFRAIIPVRIRKTDATNERFSERINRERFPPRFLLTPVLRASLSLPDAQKVEPSTRGYLRDRLLYRYNPRGAYPGFLCLCMVIFLSLFLFRVLAFCRYSSISSGAHEHIHVCAHVSPTEIFFSTECSRFWSRISGDATEEDED